MIGAWAMANPSLFAGLVLALALLALVGLSTVATNVRDIRRARWDAYGRRWAAEREDADRDAEHRRDTLGFTEPPTTPGR